MESSNNFNRSVASRFFPFKPELEKFFFLGGGGYKDIRPQRSNVNVMNLLQNSQIYPFLEKPSETEFAGAPAQKITKLYYNRPLET